MKKDRECPTCRNTERFTVVKACVEAVQVEKRFGTRFAQVRPVMPVKPARSVLLVLCTNCMQTVPSPTFSDRLLAKYKSVRQRRR